MYKLSFEMCDMWSAVWTSFLTEKIAFRVPGAVNLFLSLFS